MELLDTIGIAASRPGYVFDCYSKGKITGTELYRGGIAGTNGFNDGTGYIYNCYTTEAYFTIGGGNFNNPTWNNCFVWKTEKPTPDMLNLAVSDPRAGTYTGKSWKAGADGYPILYWQN